MNWIKVKTRKLTPEELELYRHTNFMWDMKTPEENETVLLTDGKTVWTEVWEVYGYNSVGFEYTEHDDYENLWWMPFPEPPTIEEV